MATSITTPDLIRHWLIRIAREQDAQAFRYLFDHFYQDAYRAAFYLLEDRETAEEAVSDVFVRIWNRRDELETVMHPRAYLLTAIRNQCLNQLRKNNPQHIALDDLTSDPDEVATPEQELIWADLQQHVNQFVATLPPRCQLIFRMVRDEQRSYRDVAESLLISPKTVEIQMGIALKRLSQFVRLPTSALSPTNR
ncbi:RNA polymerase sigma-70 factor [Spirosoma montaniterrae]|uniref:RNA polymerase subunit sigma-24 n=1 Tax=Spirosoma montaniterrae TaxID=1178516 RepID=A0A1P9WSF6_9BACT|nr:RNA polymerase sigma-70 factor [Spirosoma montaniterrae]AQG78273.1 hypothetical protein AWR27_02305 [Spirosoma montaniterrae]